MLVSHEYRVQQDEEGDGLLKVPVIDKLEERISTAFWLVDLDSESLSLSDLLDVDPASLLLGDKHVSELLSFFDGVEVVDDDTYEEIDDELTSNNHEGNEVENERPVVVLFRLIAEASVVNTILHDVDPAFGSHHLEQSAHCLDCVIERRRLVHPESLRSIRHTRSIREGHSLLAIKTILFSYHCVKVYFYQSSGLILAVVEGSFEKVDAHNRKDQDEERAHKEYI